MSEYHYKEDVENCIKICKAERAMREQVFKHDYVKKKDKAEEMDKVINLLKWIKGKVKARQRSLFS